MIALLGLATSLRAGHQALVVPLAWCGPCGQQLPVDHVCPSDDAAIAALLGDLKTGTAPATTGAVHYPKGDHS